MILTKAVGWLFAAASVLARPPPRHPQDVSKYNYRTKQAQAFTTPTRDIVVDQFAKLTRKQAKSSKAGTPSSRFLQQKRQLERKGILPPGIAKLEAYDGIEYLIDIEFGEQTMSTILDTGSSDTWVIKEGFQCYDWLGQEVSEETCQFGSCFEGEFDYQYENEVFSIQYGDGEWVNGIVGCINITVAGIEVPGQTAALGTETYWYGDGKSSGLIGLSYPEITSVYYGVDTSNFTLEEQIVYDPIFTTMWKQNLSEPTFAVALEREAGGYIAFGGLPPGHYGYGWGVTPIQLLEAYVELNVTDFTFYTMTPDAFLIGDERDETEYQLIVDSGTTLTYLGQQQADAINALWDPPANGTSGYYQVNCNATAPDVGLEIGGQKFYFNPKDLIISSEAYPGECFSGIQYGGPHFGILGDTFMNSVVVVFDVGAGELRFASHDY